MKMHSLLELPAKALDTHIGCRTVSHCFEACNNLLKWTYSNDHEMGYLQHLPKLLTNYHGWIHGEVSTGFAADSGMFTMDIAGTAVPKVMDADMTRGQAMVVA